VRVRSEETMKRRNIDTMKKANQCTRKKRRYENDCLGHCDYSPVALLLSKAGCHWRGRDKDMIVRSSSTQTKLFIYNLILYMILAGNKDK
jgi:hypothetical protein